MEPTRFFTVSAAMPPWTLRYSSKRRRSSSIASSPTQSDGPSLLKYGSSNLNAHHLLTADAGIVAAVLRGTVAM